MVKKVEETEQNPDTEALSGSVNELGLMHLAYVNGPEGWFKPESLYELFQNFDLTKNQLDNFILRAVNYGFLHWKVENYQHFYMKRIKYAGKLK